jgi:uncharacterized membrane protein
VGFAFVLLCVLANTLLWLEADKQVERMLPGRARTVAAIVVYVVVTISLVSTAFIAGLVWGK